MNRLCTTNVVNVIPANLPPADSDGRVRMLFLATTFLGFKRYHERLVQYADRDPEVDAVHIQLSTPKWQKALGKSFPVHTRGWDQHAYRHLLFWRLVMNHWFKGPLPLNRFDVVHVITEGAALSLIDIKRNHPRIGCAVNIDATVAQSCRELGFSRTAMAPVERAQRRIFKAADLVVCRNRWASHSLLADYAVLPERICVARNSLRVPSQPRPTRTPVGSEPVRMIFVGNDFVRKGGPELLRIHQSKLADRVEFHVCSARAKPDRSAHRVVWHGAVPHDQLMQELLPGMDIFVMPTRNDMHPWAILEAASLGLPVVSTRMAGIPEMVVDRETGILCPPGDWAAVADAIETLVADPEMRDRMGRAAREHIARHYDPDASFGQLVDRLKALRVHETAPLDRDSLS